MVPAPIQLDQIVVAATGEQRRLKVANAVSTIDAAKVTEDNVVTDLVVLILGRAAGVQVLKSSGTTGTGTRLRIRGSNGVSLSNEPLYYVDGVRMESSPASLSLDVGGFGVGVGGGQTSRIRALGPAAADVASQRRLSTATMLNRTRSLRQSARRRPADPPRVDAAAGVVTRVPSGSGR
jgi:hypothetical protein